MEISPLVSNYLNNIQNIPKTYDNLFDGLNIYRLKNCAIIDKKKILLIFLVSWKVNLIMSEIKI